MRVLMLLCMLGIGLTIEPPHARAEMRQPNIIFILADDLGYGDLGCFGQTIIQTPRLDRMAAEGMMLTDFYSGSTVCAPARSVLMTGQHTGHTTIRGNLPEAKHQPLHESDVTVAQVLKQAGYTTGIVGKWGLGQEGSIGVPGRKGFDYWFGFLSQVRAHSHYPQWVWRNEHRYELPGNWNDAQHQYVHDLFTAEGMTFIRDNADKPFFLYMAYTVPHAQMAAPSDAIMQPYADRFPKPEPDGYYPPSPDPIAAYAAMVTRLDRDLGAMLDLLEELGIAENTLVIFTSDNGTHKEGGYDPSVFNSSGPLRGIKRDLYEGGIRVPTIAWWPGTIQAGRRSDHVADFADFLPTAAELAGTAPPGAIDGVSLVPTLTGKPNAQKHRPYLYWEFFERGFQQAARMGDWKAVRTKHDGPIELYNLAHDLGETKDVASDHPPVVAQFERIFIEARTPSPYFTSPLD